MNIHSWYKGKQESYGNYIFRDDTCDCGCVRRVALNDENKEEIESYTINNEIFTEEPVCDRRKRRNNAQKRLKSAGYNPEFITKEMIDKEVKIPNYKLGITRPPGYENKRYCYYYIEDGECSLENPKIRKRLFVYVNRVIRYTKWIYKKNFIDAGDVLMEVQDEIKDLKSFQYGDENTDAITFLIKKINTQVGREWWKYLKTNDPRLYDKLIGMQKTSRQESAIRKIHKTQAASEKQQSRNLSNMRKSVAEIKESYLLGNIQNDLKRTTGMKYSFDEIRTTFPKMIEDKRQSIISKRNKKLSNELPASV